MKNIILRKAIRRYLAENSEDLGIWGDFDSEEMMGDARREAMQDIESSGEDFVDLGKSKFEKDLSIKDMLKDLEDAKYGKTDMGLKRIQKQIDQIKRFGGGSLNETGLGIGNRDLTTGAAYNTPWEKKKREIAARKESENGFDKLMGQFKDNLEKEATHKKPSSETPEEKKTRIDTELKRLKAKEIERQREAGEIEEGIGTGLSLNIKHGAGGTANEGIGISLQNKKGMNVKPTYKK